MLRHPATYFPVPSNVYLHVTRNAFLSLLLVFVALFVGILGYHYFETMSWADSFLNAAMILSGMGPAAALTTTSGKVFAGLYALFSGLAFIAIIVMMLSPLIHQVFRKIHLENNENDPT